MTVCSTVVIDPFYRNGFPIFCDDLQPEIGNLLEHEGRIIHRDHFIFWTVLTLIIQTAILIC